MNVLNTFFISYNSCPIKFDSLCYETAMWSQVPGIEFCFVSRVFRLIIQFFLQILAWIDQKDNRFVRHVVTWNFKAFLNDLRYPQFFMLYTLPKVLNLCRCYLIFLDGIGIKLVGDDRECVEKYRSPPLVIMVYNQVNQIRFITS